MFLGTVHKHPTATPEQQAWAEGIAHEYFDVVAAGIRNHERSAQKLIGPSEIGVDCLRELAYKLAQAEEADRGLPWKPTVGTACHTQMEEWFSAPAVKDDWEVEQKVDVGKIGPDMIKGSTDLYAKAGAVIDHKFVGLKRLLHYKGNGPSNQYRVQANTYGVGWAAEGFPVHIVMIAFHPRDGELTDSYYWWEPFDELIAQKALKRANDVYALIAGLGLSGALSMLPFCNSQWCDWCRMDKIAAGLPVPYRRNN